jgi:flagellar protein FliO/FliZ
MVTFLYYLFMFLAIAGVVTIVALFVRGYLTGTSPTAAIFGPRPERRLDVVEQSSIDGRRRLVLIRRDDVEHLIMTGGPVDVVIETNIASRPARATEEPLLASTPVYTRPARAIGAVGDKS